jgi:hydrogenase-1 operon protein HyaF
MRMNFANLPSFPIPVVAMGPGTQDDAGPAYLPMPQGMQTFSAPYLPEDAAPATVSAVLDLLDDFVARAAVAGLNGTASVDLLGQPAAVRDLISQSLGFGEVSAFTTAPRHWRVQETAFAGIWRVLEVGPDGCFLADSLQIGAIPRVLSEAMQAAASPTLAAPDYPAGCMNAQALVEEIRMQAAFWQPWQVAHVINLSLLPVSEADLDTLYAWLGHREVSILSRGYGNCRITSTRLKNVWWVQYFNSMDTLILNSIEVVGMPEVALAAEDDFADSLLRLQEYLAMMAEPA